jgi:SAM-dependent methyltransferase
MKSYIVQQADEAEDGRRTAPAARRNTEPLINSLRARLPQRGSVLELASGTGQHAAAFAKSFPQLQWTPSDIDAGQRSSIEAWQRKSGLTNLAKPLPLDVATTWPVALGSMQAVVTVNLLHLVPM